MMDSQSPDIKQAPAEQSVPPMTPRLVDATVVLAVAALLIFNSHLERYYPRTWMAGDGLLGGTLFFILSGYGVQSSLLSRRQTLLEYGRRRILRLYPAVILVSLIFFLQWTDPSIKNPRRWFEILIYPTRFTYVHSIVPYYLLLFFIHRTLGKDLLVASVVLSLGIFAALGFRFEIAVAHGTIPPTAERPAILYWLYNWTPCAVGAILAHQRLRPSLTAARVAILAAIVAFYVGLKFEIVAQKKFVILFPTLSFLALTAGTLATRTFSDPDFVKRIRRIPVIGPVFYICGLLTLEIYVVHEGLLEHALFLGTRFPLNIIGLFATTLLISAAIYFLISKLTAVLSRRFAFGR